MTDLANLPADITPTAFFDLVQSALAAEPAPDNPSPEKLGVYLDGDGGGAWALGFEGGKLAVKAEDAASAPLKISLSVDDWREFVAGKIRDAVATKVPTGGFDAKQVSKLYAVTNKTDQIKALAGDLQLIVEDGGAQHRATITFGGGTPNTASPTTSVAVALEDFVALTAGELDPMGAFMTGKIRPDGDFNLLMSLQGLIS